jgi:hypothetical protein
MAVFNVLNAQNGDIIKKIGFGFRAGVTGITADDLTKTGQEMGAVSSVDFHYNAMDAIELLAEVSYGYNDVDFRLGEAVVTRIFERSFTAGFRFYPKKTNFGKLSPFLSFGAGYYEWFFTNNPDALFYASEDIQTFKGEELSFHSVGLNAGFGFRYNLSNKFAVDALFRYHFIQSKDNRGKFGTEDENEQNYDIGLGFVFLLPVGQE